MSTPEAPVQKSWIKKFRCAFRGIAVGVRDQNSFLVHFFFAAAVFVAATVLGATLVEWCILLGAIAAVLTAEMFNTALELLAKAVDARPNPLLRDALDIGSAAVLVASIGAAAIGAIIFFNRLMTIVQG